MIKQDFWTFNKIFLIFYLLNNRETLSVKKSDLVYNGLVSEKV